MNLTPTRKRLSPTQKVFSAAPGTSLTDAPPVVNLSRIHDGWNKEVAGIDKQLSGPMHIEAGAEPVALFRVSLEDRERTIELIHCDCMEPWSFNPRFILRPDQADLTVLEETMPLIGQTDPVILIETPGMAGKFLIISGQRRWLTIKRHGFFGGFVRAIVLYKTRSHADLLHIAYASERSTQPFTDIDLAVSVHRNMVPMQRTQDSHEDQTAPVTQNDLAKTIGRSVGVVSKLMTVGRMDLDTLDMLRRSEKCSVAFAYEVALLHAELGPEQARNFAIEVIKKNHSVIRTVQRRTELLEGIGPRRETRRSWTTSRFGTNGSLGTMKIRDVEGSDGSITSEMSLNLAGFGPEEIKHIRDFVEEKVSRKLGSQ